MSPRLLLPAVLLLGALAPQPGLATEVLPVAPADTLVQRVAVVEPIALYAHPQRDPRESGLRDVRPRIIADHLRAQTATDTRFLPISRDTMRERLGQPSDPVELNLETVGLQSARLGREHFHAFNLQASIEQLDEALNILGRTRLRWTNSDILADTWHALALAWLALAESERDDEERVQRGQAAARRAFREAWRIAPSRILDRRQYPTSVIEAHDAALLELLFEDSPRLGLTPSEVQRLAARVGADLVVEVLARTSDDGPVWTLRVHDGVDGRVLARVDTRPDHPGEETLHALTLALSRTLCCLETRRQPREAGLDWEPARPFLSIAPTFGVFLERPSRRVAPHSGVALAVTLPLTREFGLLAETAVEIVQQDTGGDLLRRVDTFRTALAARLGGTLGRTRLHIDLGTELIYVGRVTATRNFWCKVSGGRPQTFDADRECLPEALTSTPPQVAAGPTFALGGAHHLGDRFWLTFRTRTSAYIFPFTRDRSLDLPLGGELGLAVQF